MTATWRMLSGRCPAGPGVRRRARDEATTARGGPGRTRRLDRAGAAEGRWRRAARAGGPPGAVRRLGRITGDLLTSRSGGQKGTPPAQMRGLSGEPLAAGSGLRRGLLSARGPRGFHPLGHRLLLFGRHRTALPRRCGVGRGLRNRGGRSRRPRAEERRAAGFAGAEAPRILSTSFNALISACRRSISLWRSAIAFAITLMVFFRGCIVNRSTRPARPSASMGADSSPTRARRPDGARSPSTLAAAVLARVRTWLSRGRTARPPHAPATAAQDHRGGPPVAGGAVPGSTRPRLSGRSTQLP